MSTLKMSDEFYCSNCKHKDLLPDEEPCKSCMIKPSGFEKKRTFLVRDSRGCLHVCNGCAHTVLSYSQEPCKSCVAPPSNFKEKEKEKEKEES